MLRKALRGGSVVHTVRPSLPINAEFKFRESEARL
jgi:hypothetical protein